MLTALLADIHVGMRVPGEGQHVRFSYAASKQAIEAGVARMAEFIRNDSPRNMIKLAVRDLQRGSQLLIFPEATRTVTPPVNQLSGGFALIAKKANTPIQTILIETDSPYLRKGWPLFRLPPSIAAMTTGGRIATTVAGIIAAPIAVPSRIC